MSTLKIDDIFTSYACKKTLESIGEDGKMPNRVVTCIAQFVTDFEKQRKQDDKWSLPGMTLREELETYAEDLLKRIENLKEESKDMEHPDSVNYGNIIAQEFRRFQTHCEDLLAFLEADIHPTRESDIVSRRIFVGFKVELQPLLKKILKDMRVVDQTHKMTRRALCPVRPLFG